MNQRFRNRQMPAGNPLANILVVIVGVLTIAVSVVVGFFAFVALTGFILVVAAVIGVRTWWLKRQIRRANQGAAPQDSPQSGPKAVIEGEFTVVGQGKKGAPDA